MTRSFQNVLKKIEMAKILQKFQVKRLITEPRGSLIK